MHRKRIGNDGNLEVDKLPEPHCTILKIFHIGKHDDTCVLLLGQHEDADRSVLGRLTFSAERWLETARLLVTARIYTSGCKSTYPSFLRYSRTSCMRFSSPFCWWA